MQIPTVLASHHQVRCGDIWGTTCRVEVFPPTYNHGAHPQEHQVVLVALTTTTSPTLLAHLAKINFLDESGNHLVRFGVAFNESTPPNTLAYLVDDPSGDIRQAVASHPSTPVSSLRDLADHGDELDRYGSASEEEEDDHRIGQDGKTVRSYVAANPACPPDLLCIMAYESDSDVVLAVASNPSSPPEALIDLATHLDPVVRLAVKTNAATPAYIRSVLILGQ